MEYLKFFELEREPFQNNPDDCFYLESEPHRRARLRLLRGIYQHKGLSLLIGASGSGKTAFAHHLLATLDPELWAIRLLVVPHSDCQAGWILRKIASAFGVDSVNRDPVALLDQIDATLRTFGASGRHPVLLIDEAELLSSRVSLEELRSLLNLRHESGSAVSLLLFGRTGLESVLRQDQALAQRVDIRVEVGAMDEAETRAYLRHRLECAGRLQALFDEAAISALHTCSMGLPRLVNSIADNALFEGFLNETPSIDASLVSLAAEQLGLMPQSSPYPALLDTDPIDDPDRIEIPDSPATDSPDDSATDSAGCLLEPADESTGDMLLDVLFEENEPEVATPLPEPAAIVENSPLELPDEKPGDELDALFDELRIPD